MSLRPGSPIGVDVVAGRRRREQNRVEITKAKREDSLVKKRRRPEHVQASSHQAPNESPAVASAWVDDSKLETLQRITQEVWSENPTVQFEATSQFGMLISDCSLTITEVIEAGVVPRFVEFLSRYDSPLLQLKAAWVLYHLACGTSEHTQVIIENGAIPILIQLLNSLNDNLRKQAVLALGNIAGDSSSARDLILTHGGLLSVMTLSDRTLFDQHSKMSLLRAATWTLLSLCCGSPPVALEHTKPALQILQDLIFSADDECIIRDACGALDSIADGTSEKIQAVIEADVCPPLVDLLSHPSSQVIEFTLRAIGNIVMGDDLQTQVVIDKGALPFLFKLLSENYGKDINWEVCWVISNITAGNRAQIQAVIDANIIGPLVHILRHAEFDVKKEAAWALSNATSGGSNPQIQHLVSQGCIEAFCNLLVCPDPKIVMVCLRGLDDILKAGEMEKGLDKCGLNQYAQLVDECEGLEKIEHLRLHDNSEIYAKAVRMLEKYWVGEEDEAQDAQGAIECAEPSSEFQDDQSNLTSTERL